MHEPENKMISIKIRLEIFFQHMQWPSEESGVEKGKQMSGAKVQVQVQV